MLTHRWRARATCEDRNIEALTLPEAVDGSGDLAYTLTGTTTDGSLANSLPVGLTFDRATRRLTGVPTAIGIYRMTYQVTDSLSSQSASLTFNIEVAAPGGICDRTAQVRTAILGAVSGINDCALVTDAHLASIERLWFINKGITGLRVNDFAGLTNLTHLNLSSNRLTSLPESIFTGLTQLKSLDLSRNSLTSLPESVFAGLANLAHLQMGRNNLNSLPESIFSGLTKLHTLWLYNNSLASLPESVFSGLVKLSDLDLDANQLTDLPETVFSGLTSLTKVRLHSNSLTSLPAAVFTGRTNLRELNFAYNDLASLSPSVFAGLSNLRELSLTGNDLTTLPASIFAELSNLRKLWLYNNNLSTLPNSVFAGLTKLTLLSLAYRRTPHQGRQAFELSFRLRAIGNGQFQVTVPSGAPFAITVGVFVDSQTQARVSTTIPAGATQSPAFAIPQLTGTALLTAKPTSSFDITKFVGLTPFAHSSPTAFGRLQITGPIRFADAQVENPRYLRDRNIETLTLPEAVDGSGDIAYTLAGTTADGSLANSLPVGLTFDRTTRRLTGVPTAIGIYRMTYQVTDSLSSQSASLTFNIEVAAPGGICDRTVQVRTAILGAVSGVTDCAFITDAHLEDIRELVLTEKGITSLKANDFAGLANLHSLYLGHNSLTTLPDGVFAGLTKLRYLDLRTNSLTTLPDAVFAGLANLNELSLYNNSLTALPASVFAGLTNLHELWLNHNELTTLPASVFAGLTQLEYLGLRYNSLTNLPASIFSGLTNLRDLNLSDSSLTSLPASVFAGLTNLRELRLSGNELTSLPASVFAGLSNLRKLWLYSNGLTSLPDGLFAGLSKLTYLFLERGNTPLQGPQPFELSFQLRAMGNDQFQVTVPSGAPFAITVGIFVDSQTQARVSTTIPAGSTQSPAFAVPQLTGSALLTAKPTSSFDITKFLGITPFAYSSPAAFGQLQWAGPIRFADAQVENPRYLQDRNIEALTLPEAVDGGGDIEYTLTGTTADGSLKNGLPVGLTFDADTRQLTGIPAAIGVYRMTYQVTDSSRQPASLTFNIEVAAPGGICDRTAQVRTAILKQVSGVDDCALITNAHLASIERLPLSNKGITSLKANDFAGLANLNELSLYHNSLTTLPASVFAGLTNLNELSLQNNSLTALPVSVFAGLTNLNELLLYNNSLTALPASIFAGLTNLNELSLNRNELTTLPASVFAGLTNLNELLLYSNSLTTLPASVFSGLSNLEELVPYFQ